MGFDAPLVSKLRSKSSFVIEDNNITQTWIYGKYYVGIIQIASRLVRKIDSYIVKGDFVKKGDWIGMIRFGSQVDLIIPSFCQLQIKEKQQVYAGKTIIALADKDSN